jgi:TonB family protein
VTISKLCAIFVGLSLAACAAEQPNVPAAVLRTDRSCYPYYPSLSRARGEQGSTIIAYRITPENRATNIRVIQSSGFQQLDSSAVETMQRCRDAAHFRTLMEMTLGHKLDKMVDMRVRFTWRTSGYIAIEDNSFYPKS